MTSERRAGGDRADFYRRHHHERREGERVQPEFAVFRDAQNGAKRQQYAGQHRDAEGGPRANERSGDDRSSEKEDKRSERSIFVATDGRDDAERDGESRQDCSLPCSVPEASHRSERILATWRGIGALYGRSAVGLRSTERPTTF